MLNNINTNENESNNELIGENIIYKIEDFKNNLIIRNFKNNDSSDKLPNSDEFINLFNIKEVKQVYEFSIKNSSESGILILNMGDNIISPDNVYILAPNEHKNFISCIFSVEHCLIGLVSK